MDLCHRDGSLKQAVAKDPAKYIHEDKRLAGIMEMYRAAGKKLFVATNSLWDYTHVVMNFLLSGRVGNQKNEEWLEYFDVVITGGLAVACISWLHSFMHTIVHAHNFLCSKSICLLADSPTHPFSHSFQAQARMRFLNRCTQHHWESNKRKADQVVLHTLLLM